MLVAFNQLVYISLFYTVRPINFIIKSIGCEYVNQE